LVLDTSGEVEFNVKYTALVFKPKKGDVLDGLVTNVNQNSIVVSVGPQSVMIAHSSMPSNMDYDPYTNSYKSPDMEMIKEDQEIRFRVIGVNILANEISWAGTIDEPFLGPIK
jgi:DNA-directed RNA polymerase II subunit RPB7